jgi:hypothetical protein
MRRKNLKIFQELNLRQSLDISPWHCRQPPSAVRTETLLSEQNLDKHATPATPSCEMTLRTSTEPFLDAETLTPQAGETDRNSKSWLKDAKPQKDTYKTSWSRSENATRKHSQEIQLPTDSEYNGTVPLAHR